VLGAFILAFVVVPPFSTPPPLWRWVTDRVPWQVVDRVPWSPYPTGAVPVAALDCTHGLGRGPDGELVPLDDYETITDPFGHDWKSSSGSGSTGAGVFRQVDRRHGVFVASSDNKRTIFTHALRAICY
jgi:hypothetical protein